MNNTFTVQIDAPKYVSVKKYWVLRGVSTNLCTRKKEVRCELPCFDKPTDRDIAEFLNAHSGIDFCVVEECYKKVETEYGQNPYQE